MAVLLRRGIDRLGLDQRSTDVTFRYPYPLSTIHILIRIHVIVQKDIRILSISVNQFFTNCQL